MKQIKNYLSYIPETGQIIWKQSPAWCTKEGDVAGTIHNRDDYVYIKFNGTNYKRSRLAWYLPHGQWPKDQIDHVNRNRGDDRICNLREVTRRQNAHNRKDNDGYPGVNKRKEGLYRAIINVRNKQVSLGQGTLTDCLRARFLAERSYRNRGLL